MQLKAYREGSALLELSSAEKSEKGAKVSIASPQHFATYLCLFTHAPLPPSASAVPLPSLSACLSLAFTVFQSASAFLRQQLVAHHKRTLSAHPNPSPAAGTAVPLSIISMSATTAKSSPAKRVKFNVPNARFCGSDAASPLGTASTSTTPAATDPAHNPGPKAPVDLGSPPLLRKRSPATPEVVADSQEPIETAVETSEAGTPTAAKATAVAGRSLLQDASPQATTPPHVQAAEQGDRAQAPPTSAASTLTSTEVHRELVQLRMDMQLTQRALKELSADVQRVIALAQAKEDGAAPVEAEADAEDEQERHGLTKKMARAGNAGGSVRPRLHCRAFITRATLLPALPAPLLTLPPTRHHQDASDVFLALQRLCCIMTGRFGKAAVDKCASVKEGLIELAFTELLSTLRFVRLAVAAGRLAAWPRVASVLIDAPPRALVSCCSIVMR